MSNRQNNKHKLMAFSWFHRIQKQGLGSLTATIPQAIANALDLRNGDYLEIRLEGGTISMRKV